MLQIQKHIAERAAWSIKQTLWDYFVGCKNILNVSGNISVRVTCRGHWAGWSGGWGSSSSSPRRQLTGEVLRLVADWWRKAALVWSAQARLFITERNCLKVLLCHSRCPLSFLLDVGKENGFALTLSWHCKYSNTSGQRQTSSPNWCIRTAKYSYLFIHTDGTAHRSQR